MNSTKGGGPPEEQRRFVERFALLLTDAGMPRMPSRVFACVLADDFGELTAGELADRLQVSPAAISGAVRYLTQVGMLARGRSPGARRDHYAVREDLWYQIYTTRSQALTLWEEVLAEGAEAVGRTSPAGRRLEETREFFAFYREEAAGIMERWAKKRKSNRRARDSV
jgi:DNA-binding transcriptional regulator GbsR (MarR family)